LRADKSKDDYIHGLIHGGSKKTGSQLENERAKNTDATRMRSVISSMVSLT